MRKYLGLFAPEAVLRGRFRTGEGVEVGNLPLSSRYYCPSRAIALHGAGFWGGKWACSTIIWMSFLP